MTDGDFAQKRRVFVASALWAREEVARDRRVYPAAAVHQCLLGRARGEYDAMPSAQLLTKRG